MDHGVIMHFSWSYAKRETSFIHCFGDSNELGFCFNLFLEPTGAYQLCYFPAQGVLQFRHLFMVRIHFCLDLLLEKHKV